MSEVSKPSAADVTAGVASGRAGAKAVRQKKKEQIGDKMQAKKGNIPEPQHPKQKIKTYIIREGQLLGFIAEDHNVTVEDIKKVNPGLNPDKIKPGQQIKIPYYDPKEMEVYREKRAQYDKQQYEIRHAKEVQNRTKLANIKIAQAKKDGWETDYSFSVDQEGYVIVKPLDSKKLYEIREDLGLPSGHLNDMNDFEGRYGEIPTCNDGVRDVKTWNNVKTRSGDTFRVNPACIDTDRTWTQFFKDILPF